MKIQKKIVVVKKDLVKQITETKTTEVSYSKNQLEEQIKKYIKLSDKYPSQNMTKRKETPQAYHLRKIRILIDKRSIAIDNNDSDELISKIERSLVESFNNYSVSIKQKKNKSKLEKFKKKFKNKKKSDIEHAKLSNGIQSINSILSIPSHKNHK